MQMNFREWLLTEGSRPGAKQSLYPLSYDGIGLYTMPDYMNWSADAVTYMSPQNRFLKFKWGDGMLANPFAANSLYSQIEDKMANQIEVGTLKASGTGFEKSPEYVRKIPVGGPKEIETAPRKILTMPPTRSVETLNSARKQKVWTPANSTADAAVG